MTVRERLPSDNELRSGGWDDDTQWNERAAFRIAVESREAGEGRLVWRTRAYHEEHDQRRVWTGVPDEALIEWIHDQLRLLIGSAVPAPVRRLPESAAPAVPSDDLQQIAGIGPAIARRLHAAGVTTFAALAACSLSDLAAWTGRSAEQITRMGWIERARALAHPSPTAAPAPEPALAAEKPAETPLVGATITEAPAAKVLPVEAEATAPSTPTEAPLLVEAPVAEPGETLAIPVTEEAPSVEKEAEISKAMKEAAAPAEGEEEADLQAFTEATSVEAEEAESLTVVEAPPVETVELEHPPVMEAAPVEAFITEPLEAAQAESLAAKESPPSAAEEIQEAQEMMLEESPIVFAAILLDEEGDVQDVRLTTTGEQPPEWNDHQVARFFIETGAPIPDEAALMSIQLNNVQIDTVAAQPGKGAAARLHTIASVHLEGAETAGEQRASCHVVLLAYDLASGETHILSATRIACTTGAPDVPLTLDADLPDVGRYQLLMAALVPEARALSAVSGPRLRVTP